PSSPPSLLSFPTRRSSDVLHRTRPCRRHGWSPVADPRCRSLPAGGRGLRPGLIKRTRTLSSLLQAAGNGCFFCARLPRTTRVGAPVVKDLQNQCGGCHRARSSPGGGRRSSALRIFAPWRLGCLDVASE